MTSPPSRPRAQDDLLPYHPPHGAEPGPASPDIGATRMFDLSGKTALVTGATGGIGGAIVRTLHRQGASVAMSGTRREVLDALAADLGTRAHVLACNLADKDD